jgi:translation initiation factor 2B subunit (eIF-2B alpha/beta/delta family)
MASITEDNKLKKTSQHGSNSGLTTASMSTTQTFKKVQDNNNSTREVEEAAKRIKKRRPTKVGLNDTLRRIRQLMVEGRSNSEIQNILQLEERTFYRYMAKIHEIDQALFDEQEKKTLTTEIGLFKDRLLKSYMWYNAMADNENMKADIRMEARLNAVDVSLALVKLEIEGPRLIEEGRRLVEKLYQNSK